MEGGFVSLVVIFCANPSKPPADLCVSGKWTASIHSAQVYKQRPPFSDYTSHGFVETATSSVTGFLKRSAAKRPFADVAACLRFYPPKWRNRLRCEMEKHCTGSFCRCMEPCRGFFGMPDGLFMLSKVSTPANLGRGGRLLWSLPVI